MNNLDRQLAAVDETIEKTRHERDPERNYRLRRLYLKRERLQEKSFRLFQRQLAGRK